MKRLKEEKALTNKLQVELESKQSLELEQDSRVQMLTQHCNALDKEIVEKTKLEASTRIEADEYSSQVDILTVELREQELKSEELVKVGISNRKILLELELNLKKQEQQQLADARAVKLTIISLQDALMSKVNTVEQLVKNTQTTKAKAKDLQSRLESTERAASESQSRYAKMLGELENKKRQHALLNQSIDRKGDKIQSLEMTMIESSNRGEILKSDADTKRKEAEMMADQLEQKAARERDMHDQIQTREEEIGAMRLSKRERAKREFDLKKALKQAKFENKLLQNQCKEKMKAERYLLAELESQRLHVRENKHPLSSAGMKNQIKSNRALAAVLNK